MQQLTAKNSKQRVTRVASELRAASSKFGFFRFPNVRGSDDRSEKPAKDRKKRKDLNRKIT